MNRETLKNAALYVIGVIGICLLWLLCASCLAGYMIYVAVRKSVQGRSWQSLLEKLETEGL